MTALTDQQQAIFEFIEDRLNRGLSSPTQREIADHFGFSSKTTVVCHLDALVKKGVLVIESGKSRSLRLFPNINSLISRIPVLGDIPAGLAADRDQQNGEFIPVAVDSIGFKPGRNTFALRVSGDSMIGVHICDGDIVILEHGGEPRNGDVVAALIDGKNTLKTYVLKGRKPYLRAENPKYPDLIPSEELVIQGVFKALIRKSK